MSRLTHKVGLKHSVQGDDQVVRHAQHQVACTQQPASGAGKHVVHESEQPTHLALE
jgi:hypothetical protein